MTGGSDGDPCPDTSSPTSRWVEVWKHGSIDFEDIEGQPPHGGCCCDQPATLREGGQILTCYNGLSLFFGAVGADVHCESTGHTKRSS